MGAIEELGIPTGHIVNNKLVKHIKPGNILRQPEKSFTIDKQIYNSYKDYIKSIVIFIEHYTYTLTVDEFDRLKILYNYGNGDSYRVAIKHWHKSAEQGNFFLDE